MDQLERLKIMVREQHPLTHESAGIPQEYAIVPRKGVEALIAVTEAAQQHEHTESAFKTIALPVPGCPICEALSALKDA